MPLTAFIGVATGRPIPSRLSSVPQIECCRRSSAPRRCAGLDLRPVTEQASQGIGCRRRHSHGRPFAVQRAVHLRSFFRTFSSTNRAVGSPCRAISPRAARSLGGRRRRAARRSSWGFGFSGGRRCRRGGAAAVCARRFRRGVGAAGATTPSPCCCSVLRWRGGSVRGSAAANGRGRERCRPARQGAQHLLCGARWLLLRGRLCAACTAITAINYCAPRRTTRSPQQRVRDLRASVT